MSIAAQCQPSTRARLGAEALWAQQCLAEAFRRLRDVYAGRHADALPGISHQYISKVLAGEAACSLLRFAQLFGPLNAAERLFVIGAWLDGAQSSDKPPQVEIAEASEAGGEAIGLALRILAAPASSPRDLDALRVACHRAEREFEDVEAAVSGGAR